MRTTTLRILFALWSLGMLAGTAHAQPVTSEEAEGIAGEWINLVIRMTGAWGDRPGAFVTSSEPMITDGRTVGYLCAVEPHGFIAVSAYRGLAPVRAYSETTSITASTETGIPGILKMKMGDIIAEAEYRLGTSLDAASIDAVSDILEVDCRDAWRALGTKSGQLAIARADYHEGGVMLETEWEQDYPYNANCPANDCSDDPEGRTLVGCVPTAAAQIMRYWSWPPARNGHAIPEYDWTLMPQTLSGSSPSSEIEEVSRLCRNIGSEAGAHYGCDETWASMGGVPGDDMRDAYINVFLYHENTDWELRDVTSSSEWWNMIVHDLDANRPLQYAISTSWLIQGHSMVLDGYRLFGGSIRQYHMNYGWGPDAECWEYPCNYWYTLDELYGSQVTAAENLIRHIRPFCNEGETIADGDHSVDGGIPYIYYDRDVTGENAIHQPGWNIQFLPGVQVTGVSTTGGVLSYLSYPGTPTRLYTLHNGREPEITIQGGSIELKNNGGIQLQ